MNKTLVLTIDASWDSDEEIDEASLRRVLKDELDGDIMVATATDDIWVMVNVNKVTIE